jgi:ABC-type polysaccharide/polyol phosphate transport system ATPase subunit
MSIITVDKVSKAFRIPSERRDTIRDHVVNLFRPRSFQKLQVLDRVSFAIQEGESFGIMGRNGCGKSTLLKIISGVYLADQGTVTAQAAITPILELGVGWNWELDAIDNVTLIGSVMGLTLAELDRSMDDILAFAEVERFAHLELKHFSSGMAARLAYAVAFRAVKDILILDEIFAVGDAGFKARCEARYRELQRAGHTTVLVSHNPRIVADFCERAVLIDAGRIVAEGRSDVVAQKYTELLQQPGPA